MKIIYLNCGKYELDRKKIIAVIDTTFEVVKRKPEKKIRLLRDSNLWPLRYRCSALTNWANKPTWSWSFGRFFSGFLFTTAKVVSITAMIFFLSNSYFPHFRYMIFIYSFFHASVCPRMNIVLFLINIVLTLYSEYQQVFVKYKFEGFRGFGTP